MRPGPHTQPDRHLRLLMRRNADVPLGGRANHRQGPAGAASGSQSWPRTQGSRPVASSCVVQRCSRRSDPRWSGFRSCRTRSRRLACPLEVASAFEQNAAACTVADGGTDRRRGGQATAHGQAITSMVIAPRTSPVVVKVIAETMKENGTNQREKFSPTVGIGARSC